MLKAIFKFKIIAEIIASANSADEVNSIATQAFEQRLLEEMNENPALEAGKRKMNTKR
jgi:RNA polymerase sigma-54 factor